MRDKDIISPHTLREILDYDPLTGVMRWRYRSPETFKYGGRILEHKANSFNSRFLGVVAFATKERKGYMTGAINGKRFKAHRVAWAIHHGEWPKDKIDHVNGDKSDNRIENLREADNPQNGFNRGKNSNNTSGYKGVCWHKASNTWVAKIKAHGKWYHLGYFDDPEIAHEAYVSKSKELHGRFSKS
jgi:hypothetical protein